MSAVVFTFAAFVSCSTFNTDSRVSIFCLEKDEDLTADLKHTIDVIKMELDQQKKRAFPAKCNAVNALIKGTTALDLANRGIRDISPLVEFKGLVTLNLNENPIVDISPLRNLSHLKLLKLVASNEIVDLTPLQNLTSLEVLQLSSHRVVDITPLKDLKNLVALGIDVIQDVGEEQVRLKKRGRGSSRARATDISSLKGLTNLTWLSLYNNKIVDISPLQQLTQLTYLKLERNKIVDISPLKNLINLERLYLGTNEITDVSPIKSLTKLKELWLGSNKIVDISPLENLENVVDLDLSYNQINKSTCTMIEKSKAVKNFCISLDN